MNRIYKILLGFIFLLAVAVTANAQTVRGVVTDQKGETIIGATVLEKGTSNGTITNFDGQFTIVLRNANATLEVSYVGYVKQEVRTAGKTNFAVVLQEDTKKLDEVIVVGYGVQQRSSVTGAVSSISGDKLTKLPSDNISTMLGGRIAGLVTRQQSGVPGENGATISIREIGRASCRERV